MSNYFEVTLKGFKGGSDDTDDLVRWVKAHSEDAVRAYFGETVDDVMKLDFVPNAADLEHDLVTME